MTTRQSGEEFSEELATSEALQESQQQALHYLAMPVRQMFMAQLQRLADYYPKFGPN